MRLYYTGIDYTGVNLSRYKVAVVVTAVVEILIVTTAEVVISVISKLVVK